MKQTLEQFTKGSLFEATSGLLEQLKITFTTETAEAINVEDIWGEGMPNYFREALSAVGATYFIGVADDETLGNSEVTHGSASLQGEEARYTGMFLFACEARADVRLTRTLLATLTRGFNRMSRFNPVILFVRQSGRLNISSCERLEYSQEWRKVTGEKMGRVSILRDIDCRNPHRGHIDILNMLADKQCGSFEELYGHWLHILTNEPLTKRFYDDLFAWYQWAVDPATKVTFPGNADTPEDDREDIDTRVIRLITRLMFVWFIKQKGLVPDQLFEEEYLKNILKQFDPQSASETNYYQAILQNLFFATLNRPIIEDGEVREFASASRKDLTNLYRYGHKDDDGGAFTIEDSEVVELFSTVPFLNCALFECLDKCKKYDGVSRRYYNDGFSRNIQRFSNGTYRYRAVVPNILFFHPERGLISIFKRYVFTVEENTPLDVQVALDPELLGKVFENLLGAYNPETKETARNESGSFYTPREIVQYMVNETLVAHLRHTVGERYEEEFRQLMEYNEREVKLDNAVKWEILHSLLTCKVLDPACGSGAFPMGMLQQMVHILGRVDPDNTMWREVLLNMAADESRRAFGIESEEERHKKLVDIEATFNDRLKSPDYTRKLYIIESCIYGVDIQPIAMLITRLRFFISLVCEQIDIHRDDPEHNFGIKTLPNLESKFVAADTLIDAEIRRHSEDWTTDGELKRKKDELLAIRHRHFYTRKRGEKERLLREEAEKREEINELINRLVCKPDSEMVERCQRRIEECRAELPKYEGECWEEVRQGMDLFGDETEVVRIDKNRQERDRLNRAIKECEAKIKAEENKQKPMGFEGAVLQVTEWNPYGQISVSPFFDREWMFGMSDGFDIVIGNPPYIQLQADHGKLAKRYENCGYETFLSGGDIYCLFYERGVELLKEGGVLCYITSNKWMRAGYGEKTRGYLTTKSNPQMLIDFGETHVFESATVMTNILLLGNEESRQRVMATQIKDDFTDSSQLSQYVGEHKIPCAFEGTETWVVAPDSVRAIKKRVEAAGKPLAEWNISIYRGILTGYNPAFYVTTEERNEILEGCRTIMERKATERIIRPMLRGKDVRKYGTNWATAQIWLIGTFPAKKIDIDDLPSIKRHLLKFTKERLEQTGVTHTVNGEKIKARKKTKGKWFETQDSINYWQEFDKPKIIYPNMTKYMPFYYDEEQYLTNQKCFIITGEHISYLTAFLNSSLFKYCFFDNFPALFGGARELSKIFFDKIPVKEVDDATDAEFREMVMDIQAEYSDEKAKAIDQRIFDLYGLSDEERQEVGYIDYHNAGDTEEDNE